MDPYAEAMEACGAKVHEFEKFGSYQGDWLAYVTYKGMSGFIHGYYGSCSGCDAFESEFGWSMDGYDDAKLVEFGRKYMDEIEDGKEILARAYKDIAWDMDAKSMIDFVERHMLSGMPGVTLHTEVH